MITIHSIPFAHVAGLWKDIEPFLQSVVDRSYGRWPIDKIEQDCITGQCQVWIVKENDKLISVVLTEIEPDSVTIVAGVGTNRHKWQSKLLNAIEEWTKAIGKKYIIAITRPGWASLFKGKGYREIHREWVRELNNG